MLRLHKPARLIAGAIVATTIGCDEPTGPRPSLPSQPALAGGRAATTRAGASHAELVALVEDAVERLTPALAAPDRERVVAPLRDYSSRLRSAPSTRQLRQRTSIQTWNRCDCNSPRSVPRSVNHQRRSERRSSHSRWGSDSLSLSAESGPVRQGPHIVQDAGPTCTGRLLRCAYPDFIVQPLEVVALTGRPLVVTRVVPSDRLGLHRCRVQALGVG
jgi:hypothetical protein